MIKVEFYVYLLGDGKKHIEYCDMSLTHVSNESISTTNDIQMIFASLHDKLNDLSPEAWYEAEVERRTEVSSYQMDEYFVVTNVSEIKDEDIFIDG